MANVFFAFLFFLSPGVVIKKEAHVGFRSGQSAHLVLPGCKSKQLSNLLWRSALTLALALFLRPIAIVYKYYYE